MNIRLPTSFSMSPLQHAANGDGFIRASGVLEIDAGSVGHTVVVYGFWFDGTDSWYRILAKQTDELIWVAHSDPMSYLPYANIIVSTLSRLSADWSGALYQYTGAVKYCELKQIKTISVLDACISDSRELWFLVSLSSRAKPWRQHSGDKKQISGWIPATQQPAPALQFSHRADSHRIHSEKMEDYFRQRRAAYG